MNFMNGLEQTFDRLYNKSITENGALGFKTTNHTLLDMNFKVASYRNRSAKEICDDFICALNEDFELAVTWLFYVRDVREGLGERRLFRILITDLADSHPATMSKILKYIAEYGRWDDLFCLLDTQIAGQVASLIREQLNADWKNMLDNKPISLLAKWMPSVNTHSAETKALAKQFIKVFNMSEKTYRQSLARMRAYLKVVECQMSGNRWEEIDYQAVPSKANLNYNNAFLAHDTERRRDFLSRVSKGEVKMNAGTLFPHEIVARYNTRCYNENLEDLWKSLPDLGLDNTLICADGSGSMTWNYYGDVAPLHIANALAIYSAQHNKGVFHNKYISFGSNPQLVNLNGETLLDNIRIALHYDDCGSTDIEAVFNVVLDTAVRNHLSQSELPKNILIISDMEFNQACESEFNNTLFETISRKFARYGYQLPRLIFWNVASRTNTIPVKENSLGVVLVSGFSQNILKMVMNNETDPWKTFVQTLVSPRYINILRAVSENNLV